MTVLDETVFLLEHGDYRRIEHSCSSLECVDHGIYPRVEGDSKNRQQHNITQSNTFHHPQ
jgi:hypothetical protein